VSTDAALRAYLDAVDAHLRLDHQARQRALEEIEGHLRDATDAFVAQGDKADVAVQRAISEFGPPDEVADGFNSMRELAGVSAERHWRHWLPIALPALLTVVAFAITARSVLLLIPEPTHGEWLNLRYQLWWLGVFSVLTIGGWAWLRAERPHRQLSPVWVVTIAALALLVR
jgi:hypothetical protein